MVKNKRGGQKDGQTTWWTGARKILSPCTEWRRIEPSVTNLRDIHFMFNMKSYKSTDKKLVKIITENTVTLA